MMKLKYKTIECTADGDGFIRDKETFEIYLVGGWFKNTWEGFCTFRVETNDYGNHQLIKSYCTNKKY